MHLELRRVVPRAVASQRRPLPRQRGWDWTSCASRERTEHDQARRVPQRRSLRYKPHLEVHNNASLNVGLTSSEIIETLIRSAVDCGFPKPLKAVLVETNPRRPRLAPRHRRTCRTSISARQLAGDLRRGVDLDHPVGLGQAGDLHQGVSRVRLGEELLTQLDYRVQVAHVGHENGHLDHIREA